MRLISATHWCDGACTSNMAGLTSGAIPDAAWMANSLLPGFEDSGPISGWSTVGDSLIPHSKETMPLRHAGLGLHRQVSRGELAVQRGRVPWKLELVQDSFSEVDAGGAGDVW